MCLQAITGSAAAALVHEAVRPLERQLAAAEEAQAAQAAALQEHRQAAAGSDALARLELRVDGLAAAHSSLHDTVADMRASALAVAAAVAQGTAGAATSAPQAGPRPSSAGSLADLPGARRRGGLVTPMPSLRLQLGLLNAAAGTPGAALGEPLRTVCCVEMYRGLTCMYPTLHWQALMRHASLQDCTACKPKRRHPLDAPPCFPRSPLPSPAAASFPLSARSLLAEDGEEEAARAARPAGAAGAEAPAADLRARLAAQAKQVVRLEGVVPASQGMPAGDLLVNIAVARSPVFQRDDFDLYVDVPIDMVDACLGTSVE